MEDDFLVLPPLPADPLFVEAVDDAVSGEVDLPDAQPERRIGADPRDFASLYIRHRSSFALHAGRFLHDPRDVDEVLQEAFLRLFLAMPELETELQALAYCRRTVTNLCIDRWRADQRRPRLVDLEDVAFEGIEDGSDVDDPVLRAEDAAIVREALSLLSPLHRAALVKREIEEKPLAQIAAELDIPEESVKHVLHRARRALRRLLVGTSVEPGVDLSNTEMLKLANQRLARATLRGANVLIVLFVVAVTVMVGLRASTVSEENTGTGVLTPAVDQGVTGGAGNPTSPARPDAATAQQGRHPGHRGAPSGPSAAPSVSGPAVPQQHQPQQGEPQHASGHVPVVVPPVRDPHTPGDGPKVVGPAPGTFTIDAPVLGANGSAVVRSDGVQALAGGDRANLSNFSAVTSTGDFNLDQEVRLSSDGVVSANLLPTVTVVQPDGETAPAATSMQSSSVSTQPTVDGNVLVDVEMLVVPDAVGTVGVPAATPPLDVHVQALYTPDVTRVLAETVSVVEGSAPCCDSSATTTPRNTPATNDPAVSDATGDFRAGKQIVIDRRDDREPPASS